jgi:hypothetical protein
MFSYLKSRVDGEATGCGVHTCHVLAVVDFFQCEFISVVPMAVVQMLSDQSVWRYRAVCVNLEHEQRIIVFEKCFV